MTSGQVDERDFGAVVGRISFFVNAGVRFVEEMCKLRAFGRLWGEITRDRYGVTDPNQRRFRYGVQVNSLGLTETQPENNVTRILLEMLAVTLSRDARARAVQLPTWNEALGLPRPWDQQWSLRMQQVLAFESDLLEYEDLFAGSPVVEAKVAEIAGGARVEIDRVLAMGGAVAAVESGYLKSALVCSLARRRADIEAGSIVVVGLNRFAESEPNPLLADIDTAIQAVDPAVEAAAISAVQAWRAARDPAPVAEALRGPSGRRQDRREPDAGNAGVRARRGHHRRMGGRTPGGFRRVSRTDRRRWSGRRDRRVGRAGPRDERSAPELGRPLRFLVGKPGLDGHSNGAEQIAVRARDAGFEVIYSGIRLTPGQIVNAAIEEDVDVVGLSVLSGSHLSVVPLVVDGLRAGGLADVPVVVGGIIPEADARALRAGGVARVFTPRDFAIADVLGQVVDAIEEARLSQPSLSGSGPMRALAVVEAADRGHVVVAQLEVEHVDVLRGSATA